MVCRLTRIVKNKCLLCFYEGFQVMGVYVEASLYLLALRPPALQPASIP